MKAFCFRSGHIQFADEVPSGALPLGYHKNEQVLRQIVIARCRWSYPSRRGGDDSVPLVPGIPEAANSDAAYAAFEAFREHVQAGLQNNKTSTV